MDEIKQRRLTKEEIERIDKMTSEEAIKALDQLTEEQRMQYLGCEGVKEPETVEQLRATLSRSTTYGREVVDFIVEKYPMHVPTLLMTGELRQIAEKRDEEATELAIKIEREYMKTHHSEDYLTNLQYHYEAAAVARETINKEVLFRKLWE